MSQPCLTCRSYDLSHLTALVTAMVSVERLLVISAKSPLASLAVLPFELAVEPQEDLWPRTTESIYTNISVAISVVFVN